MKKNILIILLLIISCTKEKEISDIYNTDSLLKYSKSTNHKTYNEDSNVHVDFGSIKLTPIVPPYASLSETETQVLISKLNVILTKHGLSGISGDPRFVLIPIISIIEKDVTSTAPTLFSIHFQIVFYVANLYDGTIFSSSTLSFKAVGRSPIKAFISGLSNLNLDNNNFITMINNAKSKIIEYYNSNCSSIIQEALRHKREKNYNIALSLLKSIPIENSDCYLTASQEIGKLVDLEISENCETLLSSLKAEFGKFNDESGAGYNHEAMIIYSMIPKSSVCYEEAEKHYSNYVKRLKPEEKLKYEERKKYFELQKDQMHSDAEYRKLKAELESKVAIEGQNALLNKYKKDFEYDKLPWLRKLIHLGEWDPFDPTSKLNK